MFVYRLNFTRQTNGKKREALRNIKKRTTRCLVGVFQQLHEVRQRALKYNDKQALAELDRIESRIFRDLTEALLERVAKTDQGIDKLQQEVDAQPPSGWFRRSISSFAPSMSDTTRDSQSSSRRPSAIND